MLPMLPIYIISLDKDHARLAITEKELKSHGHNYTKINAIYGKKISKNSRSQATTPFCNQFCTDSMIGCAMSHVKAWKTVLENNHQYALILEDDVSFTPDFNMVLEKALKKIPKDFDMLYLGYNVGTQDGSHNLNTMLIQTLTGIQQKGEIINDTLHLPFFPMATHAYILSRQGAKKLLAKVEKDRIFSHIDYQLVFYKNDLNVYATNKDIIVQRKTNSDSNNTMDYPIIINTILDSMQLTISHDEPLSYFLNVPAYQICGIPINIYNIILVAVFLLLGYLKANFGKLTQFYILYNVVELILNSSNLKYIIKLYIALTIVYFLGSLTN